MGFRTSEGTHHKGWPIRWRRSASVVSRLVRPILTAWMHKKRASISQSPRVQTKVPVVCIGTLVVGGSGKSPLVGQLALALKHAGIQPGIVGRGYGGRVTDLPIEVELDASPKNVGDEPLMLKYQTGCPVVVCHDRARAVERLYFHHKVDVILTDDGLQNTRLWRDFSVVVFNKNQGIGNGLELPFGPMREPLTILDQMDAIVIRETSSPQEILMEMGVETKTRVFSSESYMAYAYRTDEPDTHHSLRHLATIGNFDAIAGIASPQRFFRGLSEAGLVFREYAFSDHHPYCSADIRGRSLIITTEKDAVKLVYCTDQPFWVVVLESRQPEFEYWLINKVKNWSNK